MTILDRIVETKREEVARARQARPPAQVEQEAAAAPPPRDFFSAVTRRDPNAPQIIAEIKRASPSAGLIVDDFDPIAIARTYAENGAAALSVLTDETYFQGRLAYIEEVRRHVDLPVLRKDFTIDAYQIHEARAAGADAVLLITEVLGAGGVTALLPVARSLGMASLVEIHSAANLAALLDRAGPPGPETYLLGINNRDLARQVTELETTERLATTLPTGSPFVAESGISTREHVLRMKEAGAAALLIGESLLREADPGAKLRELLGR